MRDPHKDSGRIQHMLEMAILLPWKQIEGMRHILVHGYFSISAEVLWDVIQNDIPALIPNLK